MNYKNGTRIKSEIGIKDILKFSSKKYILLQ